MMATMDDLVQFLRARLDEDEQVARAADEASRGPDDEDLDLLADTPRTEAIAEHIARHDPARVLAEVDAKRRLLEAHRRDTRYSFSGCITCDAGDNSCGCMGGSAYDYPCETLRLLALPYSGHPEYRDEWQISR